MGQERTMRCFFNKKLKNRPRKSLCVVARISMATNGNRSLHSLNGNEWQKKLSALVIQHSTRVRMSLNVIQGVARMPLLLRQLHIRSCSPRYSKRSRSNIVLLYTHLPMQ